MTVFVASLKPFLVQYKTATHTYEVGSLLPRERRY